MRRILFLVPNGVFLGDLGAGLTIVKHAAAIRPGSYAWQIASLCGGMMTSHEGVRIDTERAEPTSADTLVVVGTARFDLRIDPRLVDFLRASAATVRRIVAYSAAVQAVAAAGLLDGRRATTHWKMIEAFAARFPQVDLQPGRLFVDEDPVWTAAGDAATYHAMLAMVERDLGAAVADTIALEILAYVRRSGAEAQVSALVRAGARSDRLRRVVAFARENIEGSLTVERLADVAHLSPRQFARAFRAETGMTPAKFVERLRIEEARPMIESTALSFAEIARALGFGSEDRLREATLRAYASTPRMLRAAAPSRSSAVDAADVRNPRINDLTRAGPPAA